MPASFQGVPSLTRTKDSTAAGISSAPMVRPAPTRLPYRATARSYAARSPRTSSTAGWASGSWRGGNGQASVSVGRSVTASAKSSTPGSLRANSLKAWSSTRCWNAASLGLPSGRPNGKSQAKPRGGAVPSMCCRMEPSATVAIPAASKTCASVHTVRVHSGQTGVSNTTSTPCCLSSAAPAGPPSTRIWARSNWLPA